MRFLAVLDPAQTAAAAETMDKTTAMLCLIGILAGVAGIFTFFILGYRNVSREFKKDEGAHMITKKTLIQSTLFIVGGLVCIILIYFCLNYKTYYMGECGLTELIFACFVSVLSHWGWMVLVPWLLNMFRANTLKRTRER